MRALIVCGCFVAACTSRPLLVPGSGGAYALASDNGFSLVADARAWDGQPWDLEDYATPIALELHNGSQAAGLVRLDQMTLSDELGNIYAAWRIEGQQGTPPAGNKQLNPNPLQTPQRSTPSSQPSSQPASAPTQKAVQQPVSAEGAVGIAWQAEEDLGLWSDFNAAVGSAQLTPAVHGGRSGHFGGGHFVAAPGRSYRGEGHGSAPSRGYVGRGYFPPRGHFRGHGAARTYAYGNPYYPYWYGYPGFSPYWGGWGPGWGYGVYFSPDYTWRGSLPPERSDVVRLGLADGTLQPGSKVRGFVYFGELAAQAQTVTLNVAVLDVNAKDVAASLRATFHITRN